MSGAEDVPVVRAFLLCRKVEKDANHLWCAYGITTRIYWQAGAFDGQELPVEFLLVLGDLRPRPYQFTLRLQSPGTPTWDTYETTFTPSADQFDRDQVVRLQARVALRSPGQIRAEIEYGLNPSHVLAELRVPVMGLEG